MIKDREILGNYDVMLVTGYDASRASRFLKVFGKPVGGRYYITSERFQELLQSGEVEKFRHWQRILQQAEMELREKFASTLERCIEEKQLSQAKLCAILDISTSQIQGYLNKEFLPSAYTLYRMAAIFGKSMNEMMGDKKNEHDA